MMTKPTPGMSNPRAATSVAMRMALSPCGSAVRSRNSLRVSSRSHCGLSLWMARHQHPSSGPSFRSRKLQPPLVLAKTIAVSPFRGSTFNNFCRRFNFSSSSSNTSTVCCTLAFTVSLSSSAHWPIRTCTASMLVMDSAVRCTSLGQVAVKKMVCRAEPASGPPAPPPCSGLPLGGHLATILRMSGSKPMSSIRSASSKTR
mmetsp:Transcript_109388/g.320210  ORF Transcript_109388/g.320210 Transcript_109388/m.320210 type:complete len:201 (+) Transcript_109388:263-865(+)